MDLKEKARNLPERPGIYIMKDSQENIIYVGKAKSLRNRVSQYFQNSSRHVPKIVRMLELVRDFEYIFADTELEALLLECRMIKDLKPLYNSQLKNHKKYVYIRLLNDEKYPTFEVVSEKDREGMYFGPYSSMGNAEAALRCINENMRTRHCKSLTSRKTGCLNHQLGYCIAPCTGEVSAIEYKKLVNEVVDFLKGSRQELLTRLECKMLAAAEALEFDKAAKYRDSLTALRHLVNKQETIDFTTSSRCIIAMERVEDLIYKLFIMKGSKMVYKERVNLSQDSNRLSEHIRNLLLHNIKELQQSGTGEVDKKHIDQAQIVFSYLKHKKDCSYVVMAKSWLKKKEIEKIDSGIHKLLAKLSV